MALGSLKDLVTGADGFIGSHLVERLLDEGREVRALVQYNSRNHWGWIEDISPAKRKKIEVLAADLRDPFVMRKAVKDCGRVFHLAALIAIPYSYVAPKEYVDTNVLGTLNVLQAALDEKVDAFVHTSTSETYGTALYTPIDEKHPLQGQSPYSASKIGADKMAESYHLSFGLPLVTVRPFNTYGPRQSARAFIPTVVTQALTQETIQVGSLSPVRDLTFVTDTVDGFIRAGSTAKAIGEVINLGNGKGITMGELAEKIIRLAGVDKKIVHDEARVRPEKSEVMKLLCDNSKATEILGWKPRVGFEEGLSQTIEWIKSHLSDYKPEIYNL